MKRIVNESLKYCVSRYQEMIEVMKSFPRSFPRAMVNGRLKTVKSWWWTAGFYPAALWLLFDYSRDETLRIEARKRTELMKIQRWNRFTHDLGFMLYLPLSEAFRIENDPRDAVVMLKGAKTLATRYKKSVGLIKSWDHWKWKYPVIIDNMMNLNYLFKAAEFSGDDSFRKIAVSHADHTMKNHFRDDGSTFHVVDYNPRNGSVLSRGTCQGYADDSVWSRGQAWAVYGFTEMYRNTGVEAYLRQAQIAADFILNHRQFPEDGIPYWDFRDPRIPDTYRDVSSAVILASALYELQDFIREPASGKYLSSADRIINTLAGGKYSSPQKETGPFILGGSIGSLPDRKEVDTPLTYGDYYYIEALLRRLKIIENRTEIKQ